MVRSARLDYWTEGVKYLLNVSAEFSAPTPSGAVRTTTGLTWQVADHHGTTQLSIKAADLSTTRRRFDPFGNPRSAPPAWPTSRGFVNGTADPTGLTHLGAREYDPNIGRFVSVDPVIDTADPLQLHGYNYANNNPTTISDPTGLFWESIKKGIKDFTSNVVNGAKDAYNYVRDSYIEVGRGIQDAWNGDWGSAIDRIGGVAVNVITMPYQMAWGTVKDIGSTWWSGVQSARRGDWGGVVRAGTKNSLTLASIVAPAKIPLLRGGTPRTSGTIRSGTTRAAGSNRAGAPRRGEPGSKGGAGRTRCDVAATPNSFIPTTLVLMADGTSKPIADIHIGDRVVATDPITGTTETKPVTNVIVGEGEKDLVDITVQADTTSSDGKPATAQSSANVITATAEHPFWVAGSNRWTHATELQPGQLLRTSSGTYVQITAANRRVARHQRVYNLTIDGIHTYYVIAGNTPVLVHNDGGVEIPWGDPNAFDPNSVRGMSAAEIETAIPDTWERVPSARGGGIVYKDPNNFGRQIRVMPGYTAGNRPDARTHGPYVQVSQNGVKTKVPLAGNPTLGGGC